MIIKDNMANMCAKVTSIYMEFTLAFGPKPEFSFSFKYKSKGFAAGCSREVIERGAEQLGWELQKLLTMTLQAMADCEDEIKSEMDAEE